MSREMPMMITRIQYWNKPFSAAEPTSAAGEPEQPRQFEISHQRIDGDPDDERLRRREKILQDERAEPERESAAVVRQSTATACRRLASSRCPTSLP